MARQRGESRAEQFEEALGYIRQWSTPELALQAVGIDPASLSVEEREEVEAAELTAEHEALSNDERAAETDPEAARWLRERGLRG